MMDDPERRRRPRPEPPLPGLNLRADRLVLPIMRGLQPPLRGTSLLVVLFLSCGFWIYWCLEVRMAPLDGYLGGVQSEVDLRREIESLSDAVSEEKFAAIQIATAEANSDILNGYPHLAGWLHDEALKANNAGLSFRYTLGDPQSIGDQETAVVPVDLELKVIAQGAANNGYQTLMRQFQVVHKTRWAKETVGLEVEAAEGRAEILKARMMVWMRHEVSERELGTDDVDTFDLSMSLDDE
ncbi:MAG: hypothetical protein AAF384_09755 [Pseudomonadota bacterium]